MKMLAEESGDDTLSGEIARHAERGGEFALAYQAALAASRTASARFTQEEALMWLDQAATYARTPAELAEVDRLTAALVDGVGPGVEARP
jgi:hypothetical protein